MLLEIAPSSRARSSRPRATTMAKAGLRGSRRGADADQRPRRLRRHVRRRERQHAHRRSRGAHPGRPADLPDRGSRVRVATSRACEVVRGGDSVVPAALGRGGRSHPAEPRRFRTSPAQGDTWESIAKQSGGGDVKASTLAIMNGRIRRHATSGGPDPHRRWRVRLGRAGKSNRWPRMDRALLVAAAAVSCARSATPGSRCPTCVRCGRSGRRLPRSCGCARHEARAAGKPVASRQRWVRIAHQPDARARGARHRGRRRSGRTTASTTTRSRGVYRHAAQGRGAARRLDDHAAAREEPLPLAVAQSLSKGRGAADHAAARGGALKARILEIYLNVIEWGDGIWGAEAAAQSYFGVPASALSAEQAALLAGAIINPRVYSPAHPNGRLLPAPADHPRPAGWGGGAAG